MRKPGRPRGNPKKEPTNPERTLKIIAARDCGLTWRGVAEKIEAEGGPRLTPMAMFLTYERWEHWARKKWSKPRAPSP